MGGYLDKPMVEKETYCSKGNGIQEIRMIENDDI